MKTIFIFIIIFLISACTKHEKGFELVKGTPEYELATSFAKKIPALNPDDNMIILTTNKFQVKVGDVVDMLRSRFGNHTQQLLNGSNSEIIKMFQDIAESVAYTKISQIEASKEGIIITDAHIDSILEIQYKAAGSKERYMNFITKNGGSEERLRRDVRNSEILKLFIQNKMSEGMNLTEVEIDSAMHDDRYATVRHILKLTRGKNDEQKKEIYNEMVKILKRAKSGEDFAKLAKEYSEDPGSKDNGGLYSNFERGKMVPSFEEAAFTVPVGEISDIIETPYGYHILKVIDRKKEDRSREEVIKALKQRKRQFAQKNALNKLKKEYNFQLTKINS